MKKTTVIVIFLLFLITAVKLINIDGGFVPGEPDIRNYLDVVRNFFHAPIPNYDGIIFYHSPPFYHYLSFLTSLVFGANYFSLRLVSLIAALILGLVLYFYLKTKFSPWVALAGSLLFILTPLSVYYSRLGLIESLLTLLTFSFVVTFEMAWEKNSKKWALICGLCLGLTLITKYSVLPLIGIFPITYGIWAITNIYKKRSLTFLVKRQSLEKVILLVIIAGVVLAIVLPVTYFNYQLNPHEFKSQIKEDFGLAKRKFELEVMKQYIISLPSLFSWAVVGLAVIGFYPLFRKISKNLLPVISLSLVFYLLAAISVYQPRYVMIATPFIIVIATFGLDYIYRIISKIPLRTNSAGYLRVLFFIIITVMILPGFILAIKSSYHKSFEQAGSFIKGQNSDNKWVLTNFWPSAFVNEVGYKITWLSADPNDSAALSGGGQTKYQKIETDSFSLLNKEGAWVILEDTYAPSFSFRSARSSPEQLIRSTQKPVAVFDDQSPNWPFFTSSSNKISVYNITQD